MRLNRVKYPGSLARVERDVNKIIDAMNANRIASAPGYRLKRTAHGTGLDIQTVGVQTTPAESALVVQLMRVKEIFDDVLLCYDETETASGTRSIGTTARWVLKPFELRKTPFHGRNWGGVYYSWISAQVRTAKLALSGQDAPGGGGTEYQKIIPPYQAQTQTTGFDNKLGSQIIALKGITGLDPGYQPFTPPAGQPGEGVAQNIEWLDITPGRVWAEHSFIP